MKKAQLSLMAISLMLISGSDFAAMNKQYKGNKQFKGQAICNSQSCLQAPLLNGGFYIGAAAGYDSYRVGDSIFVMDSSDRIISWDPILSSNGPVGGLFFGYGQYFNTFYNTYLAFELFGNLSDAKTDYELQANTPAQTALFATKTESHSNFGFSFIPGIQLNTSSLLYIRAGYNWTIIDVDESFSENGQLVADDDESKTINGFSYGLGIETALYKSISLRAEYSHTDFNAFKTDFDTKISPADNQFMLGLVYHVTGKALYGSLAPGETLKDGFYIGVAAGYDTYRVVDSVNASNPTDSSINVGIDPRLSANGAVGGGFIGYGKYFRGFYNTYLGFEIFGNGTEANTSYTVQFNENPSESLDQVKLKVNVESNYGVSFLPGIRFTDATLFYFRVGYNFSRIAVTETFNDNSVGEIENTNAHTANGFNYGPGMELATSNNSLSVRLEYTHTDLDSFNSEVYNDINPSYNQFMLGLIYHFI